MHDFPNMTLDQIHDEAARIIEAFRTNADPESTHGDADEFCEAALLHVIEDRADQRAIVELAYGVMRCPGNRRYA